jgi:hypothetical protein
VDDRSFDNLVRDLGAVTQTRRSLVLAAVASALSLTATHSGAARRRQVQRNKASGTGGGKKSKPGKGEHRKKQEKGPRGGCENQNACPRDPFTGQPGILCADGLCSCGGHCCGKGFACFVENTTPEREVCCFVDGNQSPLPEKVELVACPGEMFDAETCCDLELCLPNGICSALTLGRYRRNPR